MPVYRSRLGNIAFGRNHIAGFMLQNVSPDDLRSIGAICQHIAATDFNLAQQLNRMNRIMVVSSRQKKCHRVAKPVHNCVQFGIQATSGAANCFICRFFPPLTLSCTLIQVESMLRFSISASANSA